MMEGGHFKQAEAGVIMKGSIQLLPLFTAD
jgi:hypothetical protein